MAKHSWGVDLYQMSLVPDHWRIQRSRSNLGACLVKLERYHEAEEQLLASYAGLKAIRGDQHVDTQKAVSHLVEPYESWCKSEKAGPYRALPHANPDKSKK